MKKDAKELNDVLKKTVVWDFLSKRGKEMYFPKGIVAQSSQAKEKAKRYNATVGMATEGGVPFVLEDNYSYFKDGTFTKSDLFSYAPGGGEGELRKIWMEENIKKNPSLRAVDTTLPIVTSGLTHTISIIGDLFVDEGDEVVVPDLFWDNYTLIFEDRCGGKLLTFKTFKNGSFNTDGLKKALLKTKGNTARVILNFPNNPTGYSPSKEESEKILNVIKEVSDSGKKVMVISDDAYFGLFYEDETEKESLFSRLSTLSENVFALKGDAATKEEMVWGFRVGFITYAWKGMKKEEGEALEKKTLGEVRSTVSNCSHVGQSIILKTMKDGKSRESDKHRLFDMMKSRYKEVKRCLDGKDNTLLKPYPFNSGYFFSFDTSPHSSEELRMKLLNDYGVGVINIGGNTLRIAYSSVEEKDISSLLDIIYKAADELWK